MTTITGLTPGNSYDLNFMIAFEGGDTPLPQQSMTVGFSAGSSTPSQLFSAPANATNYWGIWLPETLLFAATGTSAMVVFSVSNQINDIGLDNVSVSGAAPAVPLPAALPALRHRPRRIGSAWVAQEEGRRRLTAAQPSCRSTTFGSYTPSLVYLPELYWSVAAHNLRIGWCRGKSLAEMTHA